MKPAAMYLAGMWPVCHATEIYMVRVRVRVRVRVHEEGEEGDDEE